MLEAVLVEAEVVVVEEEEEEEGEEEGWTQAQMLMVENPSVSPEELPGLACDTFGRENFLKARLPCCLSERDINK